MIENLDSFQGLDVTLNTTQQCNLRCKYCYEDKTSGELSLEDAKRFIDLLLTDDDPACVKGTQMEYLYDGLIIDFLGGDSLVNPKLLDDILRYVNYKLVALNHRAKGRWRASITTNGTLFERKDVREFCEKWKNNLSITVSIDGCPEIHDMNRIFTNGKGTMDTIMKWWGWYRKTFPVDSRSTKSTLSKNSIPYMYDSLVFMHEKLGLNYINQNVIMEDCGLTEEDYILFDEQMAKCIEYVYQHKDDLYWGMIDKARFLTKGDPDMGNSYCGSGCMPTLSTDGKIYPCLRWLPITQKNNDISFAVVGDVEKGFYNKQALKLIQENSKRINCTKDEKCLTCEFESNCPYCIGGCFAEYGEFRRTTHSCEIIKRQCKWSKKYWEMIENEDKN